MGADVHVVVEKRVGRKWVGVYASDARPDDTDYSKPGITNRHYDLFGMLAGVRRTGPAPKGLPKNASDLARLVFDANDPDLHSMTWYTLAEAIAIYRAANPSTGEYDPWHNEYLVLSKFSFLVQVDEVSMFRVLFAFDN